MSDADIESDAYDNDRDDMDHPLMKPKQRQALRRGRRRTYYLARCLLTFVVVLIVFGATAALVYAFKTSTYDLDVYESQQRDMIVRTPQERYISKNILIWINDSITYLPDELFTPNSASYKICGDYDCHTHYGAPAENITEYDAIVVDSSIDITQKCLQNLTSQQLLVYANKATTMHSWNYEELRAARRFNLTMTYRVSSDIIWSEFAVHGNDGLRIAPALNPLWENFYEYNRTQRNEILSLKTLLQLENRKNFAIIQICRYHTVGALVYDELKNYIADVLSPTAVDVVNKCGSLNREERLSLANYKFVFAFEDELCTDRISTLFYAALQSNVIPVVLGGPIDYHNFAPPHSYIRAEDFYSLRELAEYLIQLSENTNGYLEYLWWVRRYSIEFAMPQLCELCKMLNESQMEKQRRQQRDNTFWWWHSVNRCYKTFSKV